MVNGDMERDPTDRRVATPSSERLRKFLEPEGPPCLERLALYLQRFQRHYIFDPRVVLFEVDAYVSGEQAVLEGFVDSTFLKDGLINAFTSLGIPVHTENLRTIPLPNTERFGLVTVPHSFIFLTPEHPPEKVDQLLFAEPVLLSGLARNGFLHVRAPSGYLGWVHSSDIATVDRDTWRLWHSKQRILIDREMRLASVHVSPGVELPVRDGEMLLPDHSTILIPDGLEPRDTSRAAGRRRQIVAVAERFLGTEYVWAGRHVDGIDCSGFVQAVYGAEGIYLPRDADQQHLCGRVSGTPDWPKDLAPADLLFFSGPMGNISHVGISLGGLRFIHAKGGEGVIRSSLNPESDEYDEWLASAFLVAKRILR